MRWANWKLWSVILLVLILIVASWIYLNRRAAVYERIIQQDGYTLSLVDEGIAAEFFLKPEWIPEREGEEKRLNLVIEEKFGTKIILEKVAKRKKDFYIQLNAVSYPNRSSGQLLSTSLLLDGSIASANGGWQVTDKAENNLLEDGFGGGEGPGNVSILAINDADRKKFANGANIRYTGYYLYNYQKLPGDYAAFWSASLVTAFIIVMLVVFYRNRSEPENGLAWKLVGYSLLGGFTFSLNDIRLPSIGCTSENRSPITLLSIRQR
ncbi:hypothetical protein KP806_22070 [Paenibacillus sp. N4]|uniref:hypothetical protein n=1 Tax=Paenibacillus vietnamensis TaxID=2590547 RepID=UPI001CD104D8|nr:hypothetical protein [Paenibacillus vietnamensis]MCA0757753.1 hypothetical protein [Paenibacillus vietnamensis]